jgi:hypothetical protein
VEEKLSAFVGFDTEQKALAGCFISIGQDGTPFIDKGLVRPEQRKQLGKLLNIDDDKQTQAKAKKPCRNRFVATLPLSGCRSLSWRLPDIPH